MFLLVQDGRRRQADVVTKHKLCHVSCQSHKNVQTNDTKVTRLPILLCQTTATINFLCGGKFYYIPPTIVNATLLQIYFDRIWIEVSRQSSSDRGGPPYTLPTRFDQDINDVLCHDISLWKSISYRLLDILQPRTI